MHRWFAHIFPCNHPDATCSDITLKTHTLEACKYCKTGKKTEPHNFGKDGKCVSCGCHLYTVTFHSNGGDGRMNPQDMLVGEATKLTANAFTCPHHTFKGWNTEPDGSGKAYADKAEVSFNKDVDLYAQWYTDVTLVANSKEANWTGKPITVKGYHVIMPGGSTDMNVTFPGVSASRTETDPGTYSVKIKGAKVNETTDEEGELLVTKIQDGKLVIEKNLCKVTFDANGGEGSMDPQGIVSGNPEKLKANAFTREDHTFKEWNTRADGSGESYADRASINPTGDMTLYAQWYTDVTLVSDSLTVEWDGELHAVKTYQVKAGDKTVKAEFPDVRVIAEERNAGTYPVEFRGVKLNRKTDRTGRYLVTRVVEGKLTIEKKQPRVEPPTALQSLVYNGRWQKLIEPGKTDSGELKYSLDKKGWSANVPRVRDAGTYTVYYKSFGDENRRDSKTGELTVTVAPKPLSVRADRKVKHVGDPDPELTYERDALEYGDELTGALTREKGEKAGVYAIKLGTLSAGDNYKIEYVGSVLVILPKPYVRPTIPPPRSRRRRRP